jgi:hypothetical protein
MVDGSVAWSKQWIKAIYISWSTLMQIISFSDEFTKDQLLAKQPNKNCFTTNSNSMGSNYKVKNVSKEFSRISRNTEYSTLPSWGIRIGRIFLCLITCRSFALPDNLSY